MRSSFALTLALSLSQAAAHFKIPRMKSVLQDHELPDRPLRHPCVEEHVVHTADGTRLTTTLVIPFPCNGTYPAVMDRTPYGPTLDLIDGLFVPSGFTAILQNQRGCFTSGGDYNFWKQDGTDAYDTMVWFSNHSTFNGEIFISGASADGCSALADWQIPNPFIKGSNYIWATAFAHEAAYWGTGGCYREDLISHWLLTLDTCPNSANVEQQVRENEAYTEWWADVEANGPYGNKLANVNAPSVSQAGWHDIFLQGQIDGFDATVEELSPAPLSEKQWLWIIPGGHCTGDEADFGYPEFESLESFPRMAEQVFRGNYSDPIFAVTERYNVYVMGPVPKYMTEEERSKHVGNYWASFPTWPDATPTNWYLGAGGFVSTDKPENGAATAASFVYDPNDPTPATGANTLYSSTPCGPRDQAMVLARGDVLSWHADTPFSEAVAVVGRVSAALAVSSSAVDTDFYITLTDTYPDGGPTVNVRYGGAKMRWNTPGSTPQEAVNMVPGETYTVEIDMWSTAYIFNPGHTLGVIIASARAPEFTVNPNNGYPIASQDDGPMVVANNTVHLSSSDGAISSYVTLPVVPLSAVQENPYIR